MVTTPAVLQELTVPLVNQTTCSRAMLGVEDSMAAPSFCAGTVNEGFDSCRGDSGGPLIIENTGVQLGVVSWGSPLCGEQGTYGVYTNLSNYRSWIDEKTAGLSFVQYEDMGYKELGTYSHTFDFTNYGDDVASFGIAPDLNSSTAENMSVTSNSCIANVTLAKNESCSITIDYELTQYGSVTFTMNVSYDQNGPISQILEFDVEAAVRGDASLASALNLSGVSVYTDDNPWTLHGSNGVRSAVIGHSQQSTLILDGVAAGEYKFDVQLSTEPSADELHLYINGDWQGGVSGEREFTYDLSLTNESNQVKFVYSKDSSVDSGDDAAYISNFRQVGDTTNSGTHSSGGGGGSLGWFSLLLLFIAARRR